MESSIVEPTATAATAWMAEAMVTVLAANAASAQRSSTQHINGEGGERGLEYAGECADRCEGHFPAYLRIVPDGSARGVQQGLLDDSDAQRCPRMPDRWADAHQSHLRCGHTFCANGHERAVKTHRAFDAHRWGA